MGLIIEFSPTNCLEDEGKLFIHSNPLKQVHIIYMSVTKLSTVERLILLHLLGATDGNVIAIRGHRNVIVCKARGSKDPNSLVLGNHDEFHGVQEIFINYTSSGELLDHTTMVVNSWFSTMVADLLNDLEPKTMA
jgi:hypothetical protein